MSDTIAILTGASRGIGAAMARGLAKPGTRLITLARREDPELAAYARSQDAQLEQLSVDLSDLAAAEAAARRICDALPRDARRYLLINNAGTVHPVSGTDALIDGPAIAAAFNLNVTAVMLLTARFLAAVEDLKADRRVLNISSGAGRNPNAGWGVYCATKAALDMYSRVVKQEQGENGARVVSLA
ncbi:short-chain dehydrogenase, partial [Achromobacter xylosoxidans]